MKIERGVMVIKGDKAWGVTQADGHSTSYGWVDLEIAPIHDPRFCKNPTDVTYKESPYLEELSGAEVVAVERIITVCLVSK